MLVDVEANTLRRLDYERQISELQNQLLTASNQVQTLDSQLVQAREQIDPDFQRMETDLRRRITAENARQLRRASQTPSTGALISALSNVDLGRTQVGHRRAGSVWQLPEFAQYQRRSQESNCAGDG